MSAWFAALGAVDPERDRQELAWRRMIGASSPGLPYHAQVAHLRRAVEALPLKAPADPAETKRLVVSIAATAVAWLEALTEGESLRGGVTTDSGKPRSPEARRPGKPEVHSVGSSDGPAGRAGNEGTPGALTGSLSPSVSASAPGAALLRRNAEPAPRRPVEDEAA